MASSSRGNSNNNVGGDVSSSTVNINSIGVRSIKDDVNSIDGGCSSKIVVE